MVKTSYQRSNSTQASSNFYVIAEVELYFVMMEGYVLCCSEVCLAPFFLIPPEFGWTPSKQILLIDSAFSETSILDQA